jgi:hypothetical protein
MKKNIPVPTIKASVTPTRMVYEVVVDDAQSSWFPNNYLFSVDSQDATVTIDDNTFSSKEVASKALRAMADFLSKK